MQQDWQRGLKQALEAEKERLKEEEMAKIAAESDSENPEDWLVE